MAKHTNKKLLPVSKIHGGKVYLARRHVGLMPDDISIYDESCVGMGSVFLNLDPSCYKRAFLADKNLDTISMWKVLRDHVVLLENELKNLEYSEETFVDARDNWNPNTSLGRALRRIVQGRMSRGGLGTHFAWSERLRGGRPGDLNAWLSMIDRLYQYRDKLRARPTSINRAPFLLAHRKSGVKDDPKGLVYLDPPYLHETRTDKDSYGEHEMSPEEHEFMLKTLKEYKCRVMLCGYMSDMYSQHLSGWRTAHWDMANHAGQGKSKNRRTEYVWMNYE